MQCVQPWIAEAGDLTEQDGRFRQTDLQGPLRFTATGENARLAFCFRRHHGLFRRTAGPGQFRLGLDDLLLGHLAGAGQVGIAGVFRDANLHLRCRQLRLLGRQRLRFIERALLVGGLALALEGFQLFDRQLPCAQLLEQRFDLAAGFGGVGLADQHIDTFDVELTEAVPQSLFGFGLYVVAHVQQLKHRLLMRHIAEEGTEHRVERLRDETFHVAEALDHRRRLLVVDMHDHAQREQRFIGILGHQVDRIEAVIVPMRFGFSGDPMQHEVGRRHIDDMAGVGVERIFARPERLFPHAALTAGHALAVPETFAGKVIADRPVVAHHHADVSDGHHGFRVQFNRGEPAVDEVGSIRERYILPPATAAGGQERFGVLVVVVIVLTIPFIAHGRRDDLAG